MKTPSPLLLALALGLGLPSAAWADESACWFENGAVVVPAEIGGVAGDWLLDPSAAHTLLHETRAQMEGLPPRFSARARLAGQTLEGVEVTVADLDDRAPGFQTPIAGVIGADLLRRVVVDLDFAPCRLRLTAGPARRPARGARSLRLTDVAGVPVVEAGVSDDRRARRGLFAIDFSARASVRLTAAVFRPDRDGAASAPRNQAPGRLRALSFQGELYEEATAALAPDLDPVLSGALGTDLWSRWRLRLDIAGGRLWLTPQ
ncbi:MAG: hypothetical protein K9G59_14160 [Caulobacter sp.]|nr:hypothetical protein [Caulobacter sp.]